MAERNRLLNFHSSILQVASIIKNNEQKKADESYDIEKKKRERKANYTREETDRLVALIIPRKDILENKKNGANQWHEKKQAWEDIERDFNYKCEKLNYRDSKTLRNKYESLKRDIKKKWSAFLAKRSDADGKLPKFTAAEKKLKEIMQLPIEEGFCDFSLENDKSGDDDDDDHSSDPCPLEMYREESEWLSVKKEINDSDKEEETTETKNAVIEFQPVDDGEPPSKRIHEDPLIGKRRNSNTNEVATNYQTVSIGEPWDIQENPSAVKQGTRNDHSENNISEEKLKAAKLQTELFRHDIELKKLQMKILEQELEQKRVMHELEKNHLLLKIKALKNGLAQVSKQIIIKQQQNDTSSFQLYCDVEKSQVTEFVVALLQNDTTDINLKKVVDKNRL